MNYITYAETRYYNVKFIRNMLSVGLIMLLYRQHRNRLRRRSRRLPAVARAHRMYETKRVLRDMRRPNGIAKGRPVRRPAGTTRRKILRETHRRSNSRIAISNIISTM